MFSVLASVLEPFVLIALGFVLRATKRFGDKTLWDGVEKLVFWVLFPPLLFNSVASAKLSGADTAMFLIFGTLAMSTGVFLSRGVSRLAPSDPQTAASVRQTGYRFNSYICFSLALNMYGQEALALVALLTGIWVPISNAIAVADLACASKKGSAPDVGEIIRSIFGNPLILATLAGLAANILSQLTDFEIPHFVTQVFASLGSASMATALLAIGAGLAVEDFARYRRLIALSSFQRLVVLPAVALLIAVLTGLTDTQTAALMCYAVVPTANSCYIMATRMGGNGAVVSDLTSVEVMASLVTIPLWCWVLQMWIL